MEEGGHARSECLASLCLAVAVLASAPVAGQQKPQQPEPPVIGRTVFRGGVEYVPLDVVVTDEHGHAVPDLTATDFSITEDGRRQEVLNFSHVLVPVVRRTLDSHATPAPSPDVATNVAPPPTSRAFVFVIDDGTIRPEATIPLKRAMREFLETLSPVDRVAIVFVKRSDFSVDFTNDVGRLMRGVANIDKMAGNGGPDARAARFVLDNVITSLAGAPETRRALVFLGGGYPIVPQPGLDLPAKGGPPGAFTIPGAQDVLDRARDADVVLYTVDPHGLLTLDTGIASKTAPAPRLSGTKVAAQDFMRTLPYNTGGLALVNVNDMIAAAAAIVQDNGDYYVLGYSPSPFVADRKFHDAKVDVTSRLGLTVRARKGYLAEPPSVATTSGARVAAALGDAQPKSDLGLRVFLAPMTPKGSGATSVLTMDVDYPAADASGRTDDDLDVAFLVLDPDGQVMKSQPQTFHIALSTARREAVTVALDDVLDLPKGKWTMRVAVSSRLLGVLGTVHFPVEVPDFSGKTLQATPLVIGLTETTALVGRPESIAGLLPLQPTTRRTFASGERLRTFSRVFSPKSDVKVELRLMDGTKVVRTFPTRLIPSATVPNAVDCEADITLTGVAGTYALEMTARGSGGRPQTQAIGIDVR